MKGLTINYLRRGNIDTYIDIATTRSKRPKGRFGENSHMFQSGNNSVDSCYLDILIKKRQHKKIAYQSLKWSTNTKEIPMVKRKKM